jgi:hypothetical protein
MKKRQKMNRILYLIWAAALLIAAYGAYSNIDATNLRELVSAVKRSSPLAVEWIHLSKTQGYLIAGSCALGSIALILRFFKI